MERVRLEAALKGCLSRSVARHKRLGWYSPRWPSGMILTIDSDLFGTLKPVYTSWGYRGCLFQLGQYERRSSSREPENNSREGSNTCHVLGKELISGPITECQVVYDRNFHQKVGLPPSLCCEGPRQLGYPWHQLGSRSDAKFQSHLLCTRMVVDWPRCVVGWSWVLVQV